MKKQILSIALVSTMAVGMIFSVPAEANRGNTRWNHPRRDKFKIEEVQEEEKVVEEGVTVEEESIRVESPTVEADSVVAEEETVAQTGAINVVDFGAVADANYYNPQDGNYYSDPSFTTPATDATVAINEAIQHASQNGIETVVIPDGNYLIKADADDTAYIFQHASKGGIQLESNMTLKMGENTTLVTDTVYVSGYSLVTVNGKQNVNIIGGKLIGDMDTHPANTHNYCYGITIANASKNVLVDGVEITKMEDDGIMIVDYLEHLSGGERTDNVEVRNVKSHNNGRQGLTISTGTNIKVVDSEFSNQTKHSPMSGIDIELESYDHIGVENVEISGNKFDGNAYSGVVFSDMFNYAPGSMSKNIVISDNEINGSRFGVIAAGKADGLQINNNRIAIDHMISEFSAGLGSTSLDSKNVTIENNEVRSSNGENHSLGAIIMTPGASLLGNTLVGQRIGVAVYTDNTVVTNNKVLDTIVLPFQVIGEGNVVENNEI